MELHITLIGPHNVLPLTILTHLFLFIVVTHLQLQIFKECFQHPSCPALPFKKQLQRRKVFFPAPSDVIPTLKILTQDCVTQLDDSSVLHESVVAFHHPRLLLLSSSFNEAAAASGEIQVICQTYQGLKKAISLFSEIMMTAPECLYSDHIKLFLNFAHILCYSVGCSFENR